MLIFIASEPNKPATAEQHRQARKCNTNRSQSAVTILFPGIFQTQIAVWSVIYAPTEPDHPDSRMDKWSSSRTNWCIHIVELAENFQQPVTNRWSLLHALDAKILDSLNVLMRYTQQPSQLVHFLWPNRKVCFLLWMHRCQSFFRP